MDTPSAAWMSELEMEPELINRYEMRNPYIDLVGSFATQSVTGYPSFVTKDQSFQGDLVMQPDCKPTSNKPNSFIPNDSSSNSFTMSFGNTNWPPEIDPHELYGGDLRYHSPMKPGEETSPDDTLGYTEGVKRVTNTSRNPTQAQDHVLTERRRREKLTQRFISLSALLPDLKKMDKASVLEDATNYIKQLQTRVKELEEASLKGKDIIQELDVSVSRSKLCSGGGGNDGASSSDEINTSLSSSSYKSAPEIEVRMSGSSALVVIYCQGNLSLLAKVLTEMERLHMTIISNSTIPFASTELLIIITAEAGDDYPMQATDIMKSLQSAVRNFL